MKFNIITEATMFRWVDFAKRYRQTLDEFLLADQLGFDGVGVSDQHFNAPVAATSAPDLFHSFVATNTKALKVRTHTATLTYRHPVLMAETAATLDVLSDGRLEFGTGRGNSADALATFGVDPETSFEVFKEALTVIIGAWTSADLYEFAGKFFTVPGIRITPKPMQIPHPPVWYAAISPNSHRNAGQLGLGLLTGADGVPLEKLVERIGLYRQEIRNPTPVPGCQVNESVSFAVAGYCAKSAQEAREVSGPPFIAWLTGATAMYEKTVKKQRPSLDFTKARAAYEFDTLNDTLQIISGTPDYWIERITLLKELGVEHLDIYVRGLEHNEIVSSMTLLAREVLPHARLSKY